MDNLAGIAEILRRYGVERRLSRGEVLLHQGTVSDGVYYLRSGRLAAYREEGDAAYRLSEIKPGSLVGELGSATGWTRTATVRAEEDAVVVYVAKADFHRALVESPRLAAAVFCQIGERLTDADAQRVALDRSYRQAAGRVESLRTEKERLEELLRMREELADMIVHDLRNPLGVIAGGLELLEPVAGVGHTAVVLETMGRATRRMRRLVDTLLDMARFEEGALALQLSACDLAALVEETVTEERPLAEGVGVGLESRIPADLPVVRADRDVLQRVLINLVDNALKFTPAGGAAWIEAALAGSGEARLTVVDTGPGIPPAERERIFEKFTQVPGRTGTRRGSGLGLAFCRMAIEAHGGRIWVEDGPGGQGSRFVLTLPVSVDV